MKFGSVIVFWALAFIALGFLLSDDLHVREDLEGIRQQLRQALVENQSLRNQLAEAVSKNQELNGRNEQLAQQVLDLQRGVDEQEKEKQALMGQVAEMERQLQHYQAVAPLSKYLASILVSPMRLAIFLPLIPVMAISYVLVQSGRRVNGGRGQATPSDDEQRRIWVQLTEAEVKELARKRRTRS